MSNVNEPHSESTSGQGCWSCRHWTGCGSLGGFAWCPVTKIRMHRFGWCVAWKAKEKK